MVLTEVRCQPLSKLMSGAFRVVSEDVKVFLLSWAMVHRTEEDLKIKGGRVQRLLGWATLYWKKGPRVLEGALARGALAGCI